MSKTHEKEVSDDEFHDAMSEFPSISPQKLADKSDEDVFEELVEQQENLKITDADDLEKGACGEDPDVEEGPIEIIGQPEPQIAHDFIDEDDLRERESTLSAEELQRNKEAADKMKLEGNELFKNDEAEKAAGIYTEALKICPTANAKERAVLYGNRAAAKIKLDSKKAAIDDCSKAIELWPEYVRALLRRAKLYEDQDKLEEALGDYKRVYELDPNQPEARLAVIRLPPIVQERQEKMKEEMLGKLKDLGNMFLKPFGLSTANFQMQQDPNTGSYSMNFQQNSSR